MGIWIKEMCIEFYVYTRELEKCALSNRWSLNYGNWLVILQWVLYWNLIRTPSHKSYSSDRDNARALLDAHGSRN